ncbi:serine hydrolase [Agromyces sp. G08B096]|uniref:Beta-lactamase n=1 Tax=Agromyces sp. G08B096 TaxID=3156399 RepID=A0AAU7W4B3_9MICO
MRADRVVLRTAREHLAEAGLDASILVRDLRSGRELALDADVPYPLASVVKLPLALTVLRSATAGRLDLARPVELRPDTRTPGPTGISRFQHSAVVAVEDLLYLALAVSDDTAADALFALCPPDLVTASLRQLGISTITVRHTIAELHRTLASVLSPAERPQALSLAIAAATTGGGHLIPQLDVTSANAGTARGLADLLELIWTDDRLAEERDRLRALLGANLLRHRLAPDLESDEAAWFSKTGTFLHLRHEAGVVGHSDGTSIAVVVLSRSNVPARVQPAAEQALGHVARLLHDQVRATAS